MSRFITRSPIETVAVGARAARELARRRRASSRGASSRGRAAILALTGELGAGKTTFVKGLYKGFGSRAAVASPTFILMRRTRLERGPFKNIFHVDAYRIGAREAMRDLGLAEILRDPRNVVVVEWADRLARALPKGAVRIRFRHGTQEHERTITTPGLL